jgi:hypothetical protein
MSPSLLRLSLGVLFGLMLGMPDSARCQGNVVNVQIVEEATIADPAANVTTPRPKRAWGPEQAEGPPDTEGAGDATTAWASQTAEGQKEWLICEYELAVLPTAVVVHENDAPGAVEKVSVFDEDGKEFEVWTGTDPTPRTAGRGTSVIPIKTDFKIKKVKIYLDSPAVPGWNEIDAVGLKAKDETQWAMNVTASTTYASDFQEPFVPVPANQIQNLEAEVKALKAEIQQMNADMKELKELIKSLKQDR